MANAPYFVTLNLGKSYDLFSMLLHDMHGQSNLKVEYGEPGQWNDLFIENCDGFKTWKSHKLTITTQYLRLSMPQSVYASVNEIQLFGIPNISLPLAKVSNEIEQIEQEFSNLYPNPVSDIMTIDFNTDADEMVSIELLDIFGKVLYSTTCPSKNSFHLSTQSIGLSTGFYFVRQQVNGNSIKVSKFYKK